MLTTTRLCALFICLLRQCKACEYAGGNNSKKIIMIIIIFFFFFFFSLSLSVPSPAFYIQRDYYLIILNTCELLNTKYQVLPLESFFSLVQEQTNEWVMIRDGFFSVSFFFVISFFFFFFYVWNNETNVQLSCLNILCRKGQQMKQSEWKF